MQNSTAGPGSTLAWTGTVQVTDSASTTQTVTGTYTVSVVATVSALTATGTNVFYSNAILGQPIVSVPIPVSVSGGTKPYSYSLTLSSPTGGSRVTQEFSVANNNSSRAGLLFNGGSGKGTFGTTVTTVVTDALGNTATATGTAQILVAVTW